RRGAKPSSHQTSSTSTRARSRSIRGSILPTKRSPKEIGSTYQPQRRFAGGKKPSHTYSKSNRLARRAVSHNSESNGATNATEGVGSGGASSSASSSPRTKRLPRTPSTSTGTSAPSSTSSSRSVSRPTRSGV